MSDAPTLNSRLRILVAKTFRAEKLYSSIRTSSQASTVAALSETANDIRAQAWQRSHYKLRTALNDILGIGSNSAVATEVRALMIHFQQKADESSAAVIRGVEALAETGRRQEFARTLKLSIELIRHKANAQANKVIADELAAVLEASGRKVVKGAVVSPERIPQSLKVNESKYSSQLTEMDDLSSPAPMPANVVSIQQRLAAGNRGRRH